MFAESLNCRSRQEGARFVIILIVCLLIAAVPSAFSFASPGGSVEGADEQAQLDDGMFVVGEELTYNVSYAFIDVGQIRIKILRKVITEYGAYYHAIAYIDSYSGIPFVDLHTIYESNVDENIYSRWFRSRVKTDSKWYETIYNYDYTAKTMEVRKGWAGTNVVDSTRTITLDTLYQDGLSLYYFARHNLLSNRRVVIPTIISEEKVRTIIRFSPKRTGVSIDAVNYPVDVIEFDGNAEFEGVYGLTGEFQGWFSNDNARVPILAKMRVVIGTVRIELMKWNRPGWNPPQYHAGGSGK